MLTWKEIKASIENDHSIHKVKDDDLLTYGMVHMNTVAFGVVGQDGAAAQIDHPDLPEEGEAKRFQSLPAQSVG